MSSSFQIPSRPNTQNSSSLQRVSLRNLYPRSRVVKPQTTSHWCLPHTNCVCLHACLALLLSCLPPQSWTQARTVSWELGRIPKRLHPWEFQPGVLGMRELGHCPACPWPCITCTIQQRPQEPSGRKMWYDRLWGKNPRWCGSTF